MCGEGSGGTRFVRSFRYNLNRHRACFFPSFLRSSARLRAFAFDVSRRLFALIASLERGDRHFPSRRRHALLHL